VTGLVTSATFERDSRGRAVIGWTVAGDCDRVDISWGSSPEALDHRRARTMDATLGRVLLDDVPAGRVYVSLGSSGGGRLIVVGERNLSFAGAGNFRDLGGYRAAEGARVRWGRVFRSDTLALHDQDFEAFAGLGIRAVYDVRSDAEREVSPDRLPDGDHRIELVPIVPAGNEGGPPDIDATLADGEAFLGQLYMYLLEGFAPSFGRILTALADESRLPAVFHCAAGKDRTGMLAALLLLVLGVAEDDILDDYELTSYYRRPDRVRAVRDRLRDERGVAPEVAAGILGTPRWAMQDALARIREHHGGVEGYLTGPAAVDPSVPGSLRRLLLV
jgi:protein-tyrosine phosphatase